MIEQRIKNHFWSFFFSIFIFLFFAYYIFDYVSVIFGLWYWMYKKKLRENIFLLLLKWNSGMENGKFLDEKWKLDEAFEILS